MALRRGKHISDRAGCDQAPRRVQPASPNKPHQTLAGFMARCFWGFAHIACTVASMHTDPAEQERPDDLQLKLIYK